MVNIIGLDGSLRNFGISVVSVDPKNKALTGLVHIGLSKTVPSKSKEVRKSSSDLASFKQHWDIINQTIKEYDCKIAAAEVPYGGQDARACFSFGGVTALLGCLPIPLIQVNPTEVKLASAGTKYADKEDIIKWAYDKFPEANWNLGKKANKMNITTASGYYLTNDNEHMADAVAAVAAGLDTALFGMFAATQ